MSRMSRFISPVSMLAGVAAVMLGGLIGINPIFGLAVAGAILLALVLAFSARGRLIVVLLGGLLIFQSDDDLGPTKYAYLAAAIMAVTISLVRLSRSKHPYIRCFRPLLFASVALFIVLCMSAIVAISDGTSVTEWGRDASSYFFVICLPAVALDAAQEFGRKQLETLIVILGVAAAAGFAIDWISRRHVSSLNFGRLILATTTLVALAFTYALVKASKGPNRVVWVLLSALILAMMLVSGTRTNLVLLAATLGVIGTTAKARVPIQRVLTQIALLAVLAIVSIPVLVRLLSSDPHFLNERIGAAMAVLGGNFAADASFQERAQSYAIAKAVFLQSPLVGVGPGHPFPAGRSYSHYSTSLDTPWLILAKFGLIGVVALIVFLVSVIVCMSRVRQQTGPLDILTVGRGWLAILLCLTPFGPWIEDKGFALALALYLAAVAATARDVMKRDEDGAVGSPLLEGTLANGALAPVRG